MFFQKALKNSDENMFAGFECTKTDNLFESVPDFFNNNNRGVHILVVCSSSTVGLPNEQALSEHFSNNRNDPCIRLSKNGKVSDDVSQRFFDLIYSKDYCSLLKQSVDSICRCYSVDSTAATILTQSLDKYPMTSQTADSLKNNVETVLKNSEGRKCCNTLFIIASLPKDFYSEFTSTDHCFPSFIEYVVLGEDINKVIEVVFNQGQLINSQDEKIKEYEGIINTANKVITQKGSLSKEDWIQIYKRHTVNEEIYKEKRKEYIIK